MRRGLLNAIVVVTMGSSALNAAPAEQVSGQASDSQETGDSAKILNGTFISLPLHAKPDAQGLPDLKASPSRTAEDNAPLDKLGNKAPLTQLDNINEQPKIASTPSIHEKPSFLPGTEDSGTENALEANRHSKGDIDPPTPLPSRHVSADEEEPAGKHGNRRYYTRNGFTTAISSSSLHPKLISGCPPYFVSGEESCKLEETKAPSPYSFLSPHPEWWGLKGRKTGHYFYDKGYLVHTANDHAIDGYFPLPGGALSPGRPWPKNFQSHNLPDYYRAYYNLGSEGAYGFLDNIVYRTDPESELITSIAALLTGSSFTIGQPMPSGYDIYNIPNGYRTRYQDSDNALYRYSDGYIYRVNPKNRLITAVIELIAS
ncbi:hypothetical protein D6851_08110 [Altericroceibacterium spongiae]|uniref:Uncharacterized protein n=1 Tax=Altericroceibacterium spongiae TaxID=2320269 RepID=A0A420EMM4_9SPHN|nr:hypothetical protein [Altericroceibacterium spongiae]RKF21962.1 hypothetical protein D6851_08110 [Altericroceibacterium spongiae]